MNIFLWIVQVLLALHTGIGAIWKITNSEQNIPSLKAIPHAAWRALIIVEIVCAVGLLLPAAVPAVTILIPIAAAGVAAEMVLFSIVHLRSDADQNGPMFYWLGVAAVCAIVIIGRLLT